MFILCSILPWYIPATAKLTRGKGVRSTGARGATHPCGAEGASGSSALHSFAFLLREGSSPKAETRLRGSVSRQAHRARSAVWRDAPERKEKPIGL